MLDKDWLSTCAPLGAFDSKNNRWNAIGAGVFIYDEPFIWYVTTEHLLEKERDFPLHVLVNHSKKNQFLVDIDSLHKQNKMNWIVDKSNDLAATLFPADPDFMLKAINFSFFINSNDMLPSMDCYSVGCPYSIHGFDRDHVNPCVLNGIISGIDREKQRVYVTVPTFPGNSGGPLFVWKQPIQANGGAVFGTSPVYLGGVISEYLLVGGGGEDRFPSLHLGVVIPSEAIRAILESDTAIDLKKRINKKG